MPFWVYMLECAAGSYYTGHTDRLEHRVGEHTAGIGADYTSRRMPVKFIWSEEFPSRIDALERERQIKGWSRAKKEALIRGDWVGLSDLSKNATAPRPSTSSGRTEG